MGYSTGQLPGCYSCFYFTLSWLYFLPDNCRLFVHWLTIPFCVGTMFFKDLGWALMFIVMIWFAWLYICFSLLGCIFHLSYGSFECIFIATLLSHRFSTRWAQFWVRSRLFLVLLEVWSFFLITVHFLCGSKYSVTAFVHEFVYLVSFSNYLQFPFIICIEFYFGWVFCQPIKRKLLLKWLHVFFYHWYCYYF